MNRPSRLPRSEATKHVAFVTVGDTSRLTGGYLYNARVVSGLCGEGWVVEEVVACGASRGEQEEAAPGFDLDLARHDLIVVDALARVVCGPHLDRWRKAVPVVAMVHELPSVAGGDTPEVEEPLLRSDLFIVVSGHGRDVLQRRGVPAGRIRIVSPGFDRLSLPGKDGRLSVGEDGPLRVLCVAQWIPRKGILELVRAWASRERPGAVLELIGETDADPEYAARVHKAVANAPEDSIIVRGPVDDVTLATAYATADLFALPSCYEGYGVVYAEALAHGLPVLACDVGPVPELVGDGAAWLVPPGDAGAISEALAVLLGDGELRRMMSAAARERARSLPRWEDTAVGFQRVMREASRLRRAGMSLEWRI